MKPFTPNDDEAILTGRRNRETFSVIAKRLGRTKNSVIGRHRRLRLKQPPGALTPSEVALKLKELRNANDP